MAGDSPKNGLVKAANTSVVRYSNALVRRATEDIASGHFTFIPRKKVLFVASGETVAAFIKEVFEDADIDALVIGSSPGEKEVYSELARVKYDLVALTNMGIPANEVLVLLSGIKARHSEVRVIVLTPNLNEMKGYERFEDKLYAQGLDAYLEIPFAVDELIKTIKELLFNSPLDNQITLLCPFYWGNNFGYDVIYGFRTLWSDNESELESMAQANDIDFAIEWQHGPHDFPIRDMLRKLGKKVPIFLKLNWNRAAPPNLLELGYADTLEIPSDDEEIDKFSRVLSPTKKAVLRKLALEWTWGLVIAEKEKLGSLLAMILGVAVLEVAIVEARGSADSVYSKLSRRSYRLVVVTNTTLTSAGILEIVPQIKTRFPSIKIVVLGDPRDDFIGKLYSDGIDLFFSLILMNRESELLGFREYTIRQGQLMSRLITTREFVQIINRLTSGKKQFGPDDWEWIHKFEKDYYRGI